MTPYKDDEREKIDIGMACMHGEHSIKMQENRERFIKLAQLNERHAENLASQVIYSLTCNFKDMYDLEGVHADMWMGGVVGSNTKRINFTCDLIEDGLILVWLWLYDNGEYDDED